MNRRQLLAGLTALPVAAVSGAALGESQNVFAVGERGPDLFVLSDLGVQPHNPEGVRRLVRECHAQPAENCHANSARKISDISRQLDRLLKA